jgi:hypothetical protein
MAQMALNKPSGASVHFFIHFSLRAAEIWYKNRKKMPPALGPGPLEPFFGKNPNPIQSVVFKYLMKRETTDNYILIAT